MTTTQRPDLEDDPGRAEQVSDETKRMTLRTVASHSEGADELRLFRAMLGLDDVAAQPRCVCGNRISRTSISGAHITAADARCANCHTKRLKAEKAAAHRAQQAVDL